MRRIRNIVFLVLLSLMAGAEPHVAGFDRFHSKGVSAEGGAVLYSELGCANCHGGSTVAVERKGPLLENLASRVDHNWVTRFLKDPSAGRAGSTMPAMTHGMNDDEIRAITAYLSSLGKGLKFKPPRHANAEEGSALYHEKGCVACHAPGDDYQGPAGKGPDLGSSLAVSFPDFKAKTSLMALEHLLANMSRYRPDGRMPHFELGRDGTINMAAYLLDLQGSDPRAEKGIKPWPKTSPEEIRLGKSLVESASCASCHDLPGLAKPELVPLRVSSPAKPSHCLSSAPRKGLPRYDLSEIQKKSLQEFLSKGKVARGQMTTVTFKAMNCYACHEREGLGGPTPETELFFHGEESLGDSGRLPPPLTGIGHKLKREWLEQVLAGKSESRVRPYLKTAMPSYPQYAKALAGWLEKTDARPDAKPLTKVSGTLEAGRKLLGTRGGSNCITCHHWGEQRSLGIPALDLSDLNQRIRPEWFRSYLLDPPSYRPGTLMPRLWPEGRSSLPGVLDGDTEKQIASIWAFIVDGKGSPEGFPNHRTGEFELLPRTRPIIQRTFFKGAGTRAILVGFPEGIHLAYDGEKGRPAVVWRGAFFDAYHTWFTRAAPFEKPLGKEVRAFPDTTSRKRFRGFELDEQGIPTFLLASEERMIRERFEVRGGRLRRTLTWNKGDAPMIEHPPGLAFEQSQKGKTLTVMYRWK
ncbi:MAG: c-type cytochrome [Akkermansiaceae bacterium]|jgi:mono/diheme cytochrome c family protein